jgi:hypothetical protein
MARTRQTTKAAAPPSCHRTDPKLGLWVAGHYGTQEDANALDNSHTRGNLHWTRNQRLPAGRALIQTHPWDGPPACKPAGYLLAYPAGRAREWWREIGGMGNKSPLELAPDPPNLPGVGGPGRATTRRATARHDSG